MGKGARPAVRKPLLATVTSKGQITLPAPLRQALHVGAGDRVRFELGDGDRVAMTAVRRQDVTVFSGAFAGSVGPPGLEAQRRAAWQGRATELKRRSRG